MYANTVKMSDENLEMVMKDNEQLRVEETLDEQLRVEETLAEIRRRRNLCRFNLQEESCKRVQAARRAGSRTEYFRREAMSAPGYQYKYDSNAPVWCKWDETYLKVADILQCAEKRGFSVLRARDRVLCATICAERRITEKQRRWLGFLSGKHLQDGVYEGHTWWSRDPEKNLVARWSKILTAAADTATTVEELTEVTGSDFMARYQKVLARRA